MANFTNEQRQAIEAQGKVIVSASAGSGKTTVMIEKIIRLILSGVSVEEILAVTFTKKAAGQMKEKLAKAIIGKINDPATDKAQRLALKKQLNAVPSADISTIHSFCAKLLRRHFYAAGVDSGFRVIGGDDAEGTALKGQALEELLEEGYESREEGFFRLLSFYWRKKKDDTLRKLFLETYGDLRDKKDYRGWLEKNKEGYTKAQFEEICGRLLAKFKEKCTYYRELIENENAFFMEVGVPSDTQLAICQRLTDWLTECEQATDYFQAAQILMPALPQNRSRKTDTPEKIARMTRLTYLKDCIVKDCKEEFAELLPRAIEEENFLQSGETAGIIAQYLLRFDEKYERLKLERGVLDYNDLEHKTLALLSDPAVAKEVKSKYRYVFVDEYQDVNPVQEELVNLLTGENLFLVGDVKQAIYGFRGSMSRYFVQKQREFDAREDAQKLLMSNNFRSMDEILDAVNEQFALAMTPKVCEVDYALEGRMNKGGRYALNSGSVQIYFTGKEEKSKVGERGVYSVRNAREVDEDEFSLGAKRIADIIEREIKFGRILVDPKTGEERAVRYSDIAILTRNKRSGKKGEITEEMEALSKLNVPITSISPVNICEFSEIKCLIDILSLLDNAQQDIPLASALLSGMGKFTADELSDIRLCYPAAKNFRTACRLYAREQTDRIAEKLNAFYGYFRKLRAESCLMNVGEVLAKVLADTQMEAGLLAKKNGAGCLKRIRRLLEETATFGGDSVRDFLEYLRNADYEITYIENGGENSVKVLTMHSSKGLEFPIVILANLSRPFRGGDRNEVFVAEDYGLAPRAFDKEKMLKQTTVLRRLHEAQEQLHSVADELNLYYVALTRAEQKLHLVFAQRTPVANVKYARSFAQLTDFNAWEKYIVEEEPHAVEKQPRQALLTNADEETVEKIVRAFEWRYAHGGYENLPVKSSPTALMEDGRCIPEKPLQAFGKEEETDEEWEGEERDLVVQTGTAYHAFLEKFDFSLLVDERGERLSSCSLEELIERTLHAYEDEVEVGLLDKQKLLEILQNEVFYGLQGARLYKEQQFLVRLPVRDTYAKKAGMDPKLLENGEEEMIFQGAIDLLAVGDEVRVIDYKYSKRGAAALKAHYKPQLDLYKLAVAKVWNLPTNAIRCSIVNIRNGFQVDMD